MNITLSLQRKIKDEKIMNGLLAGFNPITLDEMSGIRLMNRTDTKFVTDIETLRLVLGEEAQNEYRVQEVDGVRNIPYYTVYFDTNDFDMFTAHHDGRSRRQKVRIRSYVNSNLSFLEVKTKDNHGRTKKKRIEVNHFDPQNPQIQIPSYPQDEDYINCRRFLNKNVAYDAESLDEKLENKFTRITLVNNAKTERLTIDTNLEFHNLSTDNLIRLNRLAVIELKRDGLQDSPILEILRRLRVRHGGFSKYCMGAALTDCSLKQNCFKPKLRSILKIINY